LRVLSLTTIDGHGGTETMIQMAVQI
jgi:hypothetical protein